MSSLYLKYRPNSLDEFYGNKSLTATLKAMLKKEEVPHVILFHGPSGCGKTTLARIVATELKCLSNNITEIDTAQFRGIDTVRELRKNAQFTPLGGGVRVYIIDECFAKGTSITMQNGEQKPIENVIVGDCVQNLFGSGTVKHVFKNKVSLERVVKIHLTNGKTITCSEDHEFLTNTGWVKAKQLKNNFVYLQNSCNFVQNVNAQKYEKEKKKMPVLSKTIEQKTENVLFNNVQQQSKCKKSRHRNEVVSSMSNTIYLLSEQKEGTQQESVQQKMCGYIQCTEQERKRMDGASKTKRIKFKENVFITNGGGVTITKDALNTNEKAKPFPQSKDCTKSITDKKIKWNIKRLERGKRRQRKIDTTTNIISHSIRVANGSGNLYGTLSFGQFRVSTELQSGYREYGIKVSNRSGWKGAQREKSKVTRLEKNKQIKPVRVESVTFYQRGNNDQLFASVITDQERNQGFVNFYDFEVDSHHSYYANGVLVHNCQKMTGDAQNAFLKILEDTPSHVYFVLCTTDPQSLLPTIKGRCSQFQVQQLSEEDMEELLLKIAKEEGEPNLDGEVLTQIIQDSQGHPRNALQILQQVLITPRKKRLEVAKQAAVEQSESIALCRALMARKGWKTVSEILKGLKGQDPEGIRRVVLGYASSVLLNKDDAMAGAILECFEEPTYNIGFPGIVLASYRTVNYE